MAHPFIKHTVNLTRRSFRLTVWILKTLLKFLPPSLEVFSHRHFGERYFMRIAGSFLLFVLYRQCALLTSRVASDRSERFFLAFYALSFLGFGLFHGIAYCVRRFFVGGEIHSYGAGSPWPFWCRLALLPSVVQRYVEPVLWFCAALLIGKCAGALACWIKGASVALFIKGQVDWWTVQRPTLDAMDARIEARQLNQRVQQRLTPRQHSKEQFFVVAAEPPPPTHPDAQPPNL